MGMRPIAEMQFIDFITCAYDILVNFTATSRYRVGSACPIVVRGPAGAGTHGGPFHSLSPEAMFMNRPGIKIVSPGTAYDAKGLLKAAIRKPFASYAVPGDTILIPGRFMNMASGESEWNGPPCVPAPAGPRTTIGQALPTR